MATQPFQNVPKVRFFLRMIWPAFFVFIAAFFLVGWYEDYTDSGHSGAHGVRNLYEEAYQMATHIPGVCLSGAAVNDFQRTQCDKFWVEA
ncbi:MAG: hypothetical protein ACXWOH_13015, partial [Bdellovibrionota bacterium]